MNYLVTGGAGFIGSHLAEELLRRGECVCVIDDLSTGAMANIEHLRKQTRFSYHIDSIFNRPLLAELIDNADVVLHLAAAVGVQLIVESPVRTIETNATGTEIVLKLASKKKKLVVEFSTSEVYGKSDRAKFSEDDDLVLGPTSRGRWSYAASKIINEFLTKAYWKEYGVPVIIVRLFNTVGPRQTGRYGMVVPRFVSRALKGEPISVYGDGRQTRTFTHVKDAVWAVLRLVELPRAVGEVWNVGGKDEISIRDLAVRVKSITGSASSIVNVSYADAYMEGFEDMQRRVPDLTKIQALTGYQPKYGLDDIILDVADFYKEKGDSTWR